MTKPTTSHNNPVSIGIDFHKRYSVFCVLDAKGGILERGRIEHTTPELFVELAKRYPKARVVFETTMNCPSLRSRLANLAFAHFQSRQMAAGIGRGSTKSSSPMWATRTSFWPTPSRPGSSPSPKSKTTKWMPTSSPDFCTPA